MRRMSVAHLGRDLLRSCRTHGDAPALESPELALSYRELAQHAEALAAVLVARGLRGAEPVPVMVSNHPLDLAAFAAVWLAGGVVVPVHRGNPEGAVAGFLDACGARIAVDALGGAAFPPPWTRDGELLVGHRPAPGDRPLLEDGAFVIFTSGSTGKPKGVVLSHRAFGGKLAAIDSLLHFAAGERTLLVLNLTFSFGNWVSLLTLMTGGTVVMHEKFVPRSFVDALANAAIDRVGVVPTMMRALFAELPDGCATPPPVPPSASAQSLRDAPYPREILIGGESLGGPLAAQIDARFPRSRLIDIYGLTETSTSDFFLFPEDRPRYASCIGRPSPGVRYRIAATGGGEAAPGEIGELQIRTPFAMNGYLDAPELTAAAYADGWLRTGDLARLRDGEVVELAGRAKEIISRGGNKVSPLEIEQVFAAHPDVAAAMATGVADPILGERIHLLVVARPGRAPTQEALREFAASSLPRFKQPDAIHFGAELPLGRTGKADRAALRRMIEAGSLEPRVR